MVSTGRIRSVSNKNDWSTIDRYGRFLDPSLTRIASNNPLSADQEVIEGELEVTIEGETQIARAGMVAIVPGNVRHSVKALTDGRAIIVDYPLRRDFDQVDRDRKRVARVISPKTER